MGRRCTICTHPDRLEIEREATLGETALTRLGAKFGVSESAIRRHCLHHLGPNVAQAAEVQRLAEADDLLDQVTALQSKCYDLLAMAEGTRDVRGALAAVRECARLVELLAKLTGRLRGGTTVNLTVNEWRAVVNVVVDALDEYPTAKARVIEALEGYRLTEGGDDGQAIIDGD